jgi:hypothetical protein
VQTSLEWLSREPFDWIHRLSQVIDALLKDNDALTDLVFDLPPGVWGFGHEMLVLVSALSREQPLPAGYPGWDQRDIAFETKPYLVMTQDPGDMLPSLEYFARQALVQRRLPTLVPVVNRTTRAPETVRKDARALLGPALSSLGVDQRLVFVDELRATLGRIFVEPLAVSDDAVRTVGATLGVGKGP